MIDSWLQIPSLPEGAMFLPPMLRPLPDAAASGVAPLPGWVDQLADAPVSLLRGPPGSYLAERLAAAVLGWGRWSDCVWLRPPEASGATIEALLADACRHRWGERAGSSTPEQPFRPPHEAVVVLELRTAPTPGIYALLHRLRPAFAASGASLVTVLESRLPVPRPAGVPAFPAGELLADGAGSAALDDVRRNVLRRFAGARAAVVHDIGAAAEAWPADLVHAALDGVRHRRELLDRVTAAVLGRCGPAQRTALQTCVAGGYWHPELTGGGVQLSGLRPWVMPLEHGWGWLRPVWGRALQRHLAVPASSTTPRASVLDLGQRQPVPAPGRTVAGTQAPGRSVLEARLLGSFEVRIDGVPVTGWNGTRGPSVLRYLLSRRRHACSRDELLEEFWPGVAPQAARNRLQVVISGLRRAFLPATRTQVIEYADGGYRLNPDLRLVIDTEEFEAKLDQARRAERAGNPDAAVSAYRAATRLYRGDLAADAPFEPWTLLPRESLQLAFIDALDRLGRVEFGSGRLEDCISTGHRMLDVDPCHEDAHRLLMRCYLEQGRIYPALRQYEFCRRVLRATLQVEPAARTTRLYDVIRAGASPAPARVASLPW